MFNYRFCVAGVSGVVGLAVGVVGASPHASIVAVGLGSAGQVYSYAARLSTADTVRLCMVAYASNCWRSSSDFTARPKERIRLGSGAVFSTCAMFGCLNSPRLSRNLISATRKSAEQQGAWVLICSSSSGDSENVTEVERRNGERLFIVGFGWVYGISNIC